MKTLHETPFAKLELDQENGVIITHWSSHSGFMREEELQEYYLMKYEFTKEYQIKYVLVDSSKRQIAYSLGLQEWVAKIVQRLFVELKIHKLASILPEELIANLSTTQAIDEIQKQENAKIADFASIEEAYKWFKTN